MLENVCQTPKRQPTYEECIQAIKIIRTNMRGRSIHRALIELYKNIHQSREEKIISQYTPDAEENVRQFTKEQSRKVKFASKDEENKYNEKRILAKVFVRVGYGLENAQRELEIIKCSITLTPESYNSSIGSILIEALRRLESFLIGDCHKNIQPFTKYEIQSIMPTLYNIEKDFSATQKIVFNKFLRVKYGLSNVTIGEIQSVHFYVRIWNLIHKEFKSMHDIQLGQDQQAGEDQYKSKIQMVDQYENDSNQDKKGQKHQTPNQFKQDQLNQNASQDFGENILGDIEFEQSNHSPSKIHAQDS